MITSILSLFFAAGSVVAWFLWAAGNIEYSGRALIIAVVLTIITAVYAYVDFRQQRGGY